MSRFIVRLEANGTDQCRGTGDELLCTTHPARDLAVTYTVPTFKFMRKTNYTVRVTADSLLGEGGEATLTFKTGEVSFMDLCEVHAW